MAAATPAHRRPLGRDMNPLRCVTKPLAGFVCLIAIVATPPVEGRTWTNTDGQTLEAEFIRLSNRAALLKAGEKTITAPLNRLSQEDRDWVDRYKELMRSRDWGRPEGPTYQGRYAEAKNGKLRVKHGSKTHLIPYEELSDDDWRYAKTVMDHLEAEMPEELVALKPAPELTLADGIKPSQAVERSWTDSRGREIVAGYLGVHESNALLWMRDKEFKVPLEKLSADDRRWIASQSLSKMNGSLQLTMAAVSQITSRAMMQGPPPPEVLKALQPPTPPAPAPPDMAPPAPQQVSAPPQPTAPLPSRVQHIDDLTEDQYDAVILDAFGEDYESGGFAECYNCEGGFEYPADFGMGDPCPFCNEPVTEFITNEEFEKMSAEIVAKLGGESRPWYLQRWVRRLVITVVLAGIGVGVKIATGGE